MEKPRLLLMDEPTNSLDEESVNLFRSIMLEEKKRGALIIVASHNKDDIRLLCDDIYHMDNGKITPSDKERL